MLLSAHFRKAVLTVFAASIPTVACAINVNWDNTVISGSGLPLIGTKMTKDSDDKVYYAGSDRNIYMFDLKLPSSSAVNLSALSANPAIPVVNYSHLLATPGHVFYVGTNGRLMNLWLNGSQWNCDALSNSIPNVLTGTGIAVDEYGRIHYVGSDSKLYQLTWSSGSGWTANAFPTPAVSPGIYSDLVAHDGHVFYQGTDMKLYNYYWTNTWNNAVLNPSATTAISGSNIELDVNGTVTYLGSDGKIYHFTWNNNSGWVATAVHGTRTATPFSAPRIQLDEGKTFFADATSNTISFFFTPNGGTVGFANIYYNNSTTATAYNAANKTDILVSGNGDVVYTDSSDSKLHLLRPILIWNSVTVLTGLKGTFVGSTVLDETSINRVRRPVDLQFYPRNTCDIGIVPFEGYVWGFKNVTFKADKTLLNGSSSSVTQTFSLDQLCNFVASMSIHAELSEYAFSYRLNGQTQYTKIASNVVCGDAYLVSGQSNTTGDATDDTASLENQFGSTQPSGYGKYSRVYGNGTDYFCNNWGTPVESAGPWCANWVGWSFTIPLQYKLQQTYHIPICVIHNGLGSQEIAKFLNPAGHPPSELYFNFYSNNNWAMAFEGIQNHMIRRVYETGLEHGIKGFIWYQGESDVDVAHTAAYKGNFKQMYDELISWIPGIPRTYLVQIHSQPPSTPNDVTPLSEVQRTMPSYVPYANIRIVSANGARYPNCNGMHFDIQAYIEIADRLVSAMKTDFYENVPFDVGNLPPDIISAKITGSKLVLQFNQPLNTSNSDPLNDVIKAVRPNNGAVISAPSINNDKLTMTLSSSAGLTSVSYLGLLPCNTGVVSPGCPTSDPNYSPTYSLDWWCPCYLRNANGIAALSFGNFPVTP